LKASLLVRICQIPSYSFHPVIVCVFQNVPAISLGWLAACTLETHALCKFSPFHSIPGAMISVIAEAMLPEAFHQGGDVTGMVGPTSSYHTSKLGVHTHELISFPFLLPNSGLFVRVSECPCRKNDSTVKQHRLGTVSLFSSNFISSFD
jgi:hypothetical protein